MIKKNIKDIPIYIPVSDDEKLDDDILKGKLVFSTFHQAKGLERKVVLVFGFDNSYFIYYKKNMNTLKCPDELYVACTRALEHLVLFHHYKNDFLPFLNIKNIDKYCDYQVKRLEIIKRNNNTSAMIPVTELIKYLPVDVINTCVSYLDIIKIKEISEKINIDSKTLQKAGYESVSEITGTAIPAYFEYKLKGFMTIYDKNDDDDINLDTMSCSNLLYITNKYCSNKNKLLFKLDQITNYDWLSDDNLTLALERLINLDISKNAIFEKKVEIIDKNIVGFIDCIDNNNIYEFKCVSKLEIEHYLQLAIYMYLFETNYNITENKIITKHYYLYNILTNELLEIKCEYEQLKLMMDYLIDMKSKSNTFLSDNDFIIKIEDIYKKNIENNFHNKDSINISMINDENPGTIMFLDTETIGIPYSNNYKDLYKFNKARLIELGYIIYDKDKNKIKEYNNLVIPNNFSINNSEIHGITNIDANTNGQDIKKVLNDFYEDLLNIDTIICHNIIFDMNILLSEAYRMNNENLIKAIESKNKICTMKMGKSYLGIKMKFGPKLVKLYETLYNEPIKQDHRALSDCDICAKCYYKMQK